MIAALIGQAPPTPSTTVPCVVQPAKVTGLCTAAKSLHIPVQYRFIMPELILIGGALIILSLYALLPKRSRPLLWVSSTVATGLAALGWSFWLWQEVDAKHSALIIGNALAIDGFTVFFMVLVSSAIILAALAADSYLRREGLVGPEFYVLALLSGSGAMMMAEANDLLVVFLALEILSIALYVLAGYHRRRRESGEAAMKYFLLGAFSSAIFLYGVALVYGATGSTRLDEIASFLAQNHLPKSVLLAGVALLIVGLAFKVAAVPFRGTRA